MGFRKMIISNPRLLWADSLKGWLMILVVFGHAMQAVMSDGCFHNHLWNMIYSFHMPAFMTVSGYFAYRVHRNGGGKSLCSRRFLQLMVPYVGVRILLPIGSDAVFVGLSFVLCLFLTFCIVEGLKKNKITAKVFLGKL